MDMENQVEIKQEVEQLDTVLIKSEKADSNYGVQCDRIKTDHIEETWDGEILSKAVDQIKKEQHPAVAVKCENSQEEPDMNIIKTENINTSELNEELDIKPDDDPAPSTDSARVAKQGLELQPEKELFFCYKCAYTASSKVTLTRHISIGKCNGKSNLDRSQLARPMNVYVCAQCNKVFKGKSTLNDHVSKKHAELATVAPSRMHQCTQCSYRAANKKHVIKHMLIHPNAVFESNVCKHCNTSFRSSQGLDNHIIQKHPKFIASVKRKIHKCTHCTYKTIYKYHFREHMLTHSSTECRHCNVTFKSKRLLDDHIVNQHRDAVSCYNLIACEHCDTTYKTKKLLDDHILKKHPDFVTSVAGKIYNCLCCAYKTTVIQYFNRHLLSHSSDVGNVSVCDYCGAQFKRKRSLDDHIVKKHPDFSASVSCKVHECPNCDYKTAQKIDLDRHILKHPEAVSLHNIISCKHCNMSFKSQQSLRNHIIRQHPDLMASVTGKIHECSYCTYKTSMRHMFHEHIIKKHPNFVDPDSCNIYECSNCDYKTTKKDNLDRHTLKHSGGPKDLISCQYCNATYKGKQSLDYHIVKKHPDFIGSVNREIYKCSICPYTNLRKYMLEKHMLRHASRQDYVVQ